MKTKTLTIVIPILSAVIVLALITATFFYFLFNTATETPYKIVQNKVLDNPDWLRDAEVLSQERGGVSIDEYITLHAQVTEQAKQSMLDSATVIKDCHKDRTRCTSPTWLEYSVIEEQLGLGMPDIDEPDQSILCTARWGEIRENNVYNNKDTICIKPSTNELWYEYFDI